MLQALLLESAIGSRAAGGSAGGALPHLLRVVLLRQQLSAHPCRTITSLACGEEVPPRVNEVLETAQPSCSTRSCSDNGVRTNSAASVLGAGGNLWSGLLYRLPFLSHHYQYHHQQQQQQQQRQHWVQLQCQQRHRGISTTSAVPYKFDSHLTRYNKAKVVNRDNFQRFRDSGRDARVAADILQEGERLARRGGGRGRGRNEADEALLELRSMVHDCRDLRSMQVLVRECAGDMDGFMVCSILGRLPQLKQDTPAAAGPEALAHRVARMLSTRLEALASTTSASNMAHAMIGLANSGLMPPGSLLAAVAGRLCISGSHGGGGGGGIAEADAKAVSKLLLATAKFLDMVKPHAWRGGGAGGGYASGGAVAVVTATEEGLEDVLRLQFWPAVRTAAEVKLLRALGEEPSETMEAAQGRGGVEEDDSMPQTALRYICIALALAREAHPGTWKAAARLAARHAADLEPAVAAGVLRSYAIAGGTALDGGEAQLFEAVWAVLGPQVEGLDVETQVGLLIGALKLAATKEATTAAQAIPVLCRIMATRVPALSVSDASHLTIALAEMHTKSVSVAAAAATAASAKAAPWQPHSFGALPRLLADLLVLRGIGSFGVSKFVSAALGLGLLGYTPLEFWRHVAAAAAPEVTRMDATALSRLLGAFHNAALAAETSAAAGGGRDAAATAVLPAPDTELLAAAHARAQSLLTDGELTGKPLFHMVRSLAEWPLPQDGALQTLTALANQLLADGRGAAEVAAAPPTVRQRMLTALRRVGLSEHALVARLAAGQ